MLEAATFTKVWHAAAAGLWSFPVLQKSYRQLLYRRDRKQNLKTHTLFWLLIHLDT